MKTRLATGCFYALVLLWVNAYVCRELLFSHTAAHMNSMQGFWIALSQSGHGWFSPEWWPYWDCGIPFEFTYAPLVPALSAAIAWVRGIPNASAFQMVSGYVYCALPITVFLMAWILTRAPGYSFFAALLYSLTSPTQILIPDETFSLARFWEARRFYLLSVWDETPHLAALALLPLVVVFLSLSIRKRRLTYYVISVLLIAATALASAFGPVIVSMAVLCLLFVLRRENWKQNIALTAAIGVLAYAIAAPFNPPSLFAAIKASSKGGGDGWTIGSLTGLLIVAAGWALLWRRLPRWTEDWTIQFFALFAYLATSIPVLATYLHRSFVPQPNRYKLEAEMALCLIMVFGLRPWFDRIPKSVKVTAICLILSLAGEQLISHRKFAKDVFRPEDITRTIEYRVANWTAQNLKGVRVMMPGSIAQWANAFGEIQQFSGSSWSMAYNQVQQRALREIYSGDSKVALTWLRAYGAGAVTVSGPNSQEFWKPFKNPSKFEGLLPALWKQDDVTIYRIPRRADSLAHVVPANALVKREPGDVSELAPYVAALEDSSLPAAEFRWEDRNRIRIQAGACPRGYTLSVQTSYHPGWHARLNGQALKVESDGLGLIALRPQCPGPCEIELTYDGGLELRVCRAISYLALILLAAAPFLLRLRRS